MNFKVAVLRETKTPPDKRTVLVPQQAKDLQNIFPNIEIFIQRSNIRCYKDSEYEALGLNMCDDVSHCDILLGVKEVNKPDLIEGKTYLFFSHTAKKQIYNKALLQLLLSNKIRMIDHEYLTAKQGARLVAFGHWAGVVGAYNGMIAYGKRTGQYDLKRAIDCKDEEELANELKSKVKLGQVKILVTGDGRVASGALQTISRLNIKKVSPQDFLTQKYSEPVFTQLSPEHYVKPKSGAEFNLTDFFKNPADYESTFLPYTKVTDLYFACHFWDEKSPYFFTKEDVKSPDFKISVIADVSCDIDGPIPTTIRSSEIANPYYGYNKKTGLEADAFEPDCVTVMAVDNLPGELPRDASVDFGKALTEKVFPALFGEDTDEIIKRATITENGKLTPKFNYLSKFAGIE